MSNRASCPGSQSAASIEASATPQIPAVGGVFRDALSGGGQGSQMVVLPAGSFRMGSPSTEAHRSSDEGPVRTVTISRGIAIGRHEVTFTDYDRFVAARSGTRRPGDEGWGRGTRPVINMSRDDAKAYVAWLGTQTGKTYRLPSQAEWEYAARASMTTVYAFGASINCSQASYGRPQFSICNRSGDANLARTVAVGSFPANAFGLYDMHGNVAEWVEDCFGSYTEAPTDGSARTCSPMQIAVLRNGGWYTNEQGLRSVYRDRS